MSVDGKFLNGFRGSINKTKQILLARCEGKFRDTCIWRADKGCVLAWIIHLSVDQVVVGQRYNPLKEKKKSV